MISIPLAKSSDLYLPQGNFCVTNGVLRRQLCPAKAGPGRANKLKDERNRDSSIWLSFVPFRVSYPPGGRIGANIEIHAKDPAGGAERKQLHTFSVILSRLPVSQELLN